MIINFSISYGVILSKKGDAARISIAAEEVSLVQSYVKEFFYFLKTYKMKKVQITIGKFESQLKYLIEGGEIVSDEQTVKLDRSSNELIQEKLQEVDLQWKKLKETAASAVDAEDVSSSYKKMIDQSDSLSKLMSNIVDLYKQESDRKLELIKYGQILGIILGICFFALGFLTVKKIKKCVRELAGFSNHVTSNADKLSKENDNLSKRTTSQTSYLQQTAAALEEITATVRQTSSDVDVMAKSASNVVDLTNEYSKETELVSQAMTIINENSHKISSFVQSVEEIAFQTNILAINAAIEAAKAGDLGKGFAVVAIEVRELAERAAEAAREINELVSRNLTNVQQGVDLVVANKEKIEIVTSETGKTSTLTDGVSEAMKEQSSAINHINDNVIELDQVTRQNSGLVDAVKKNSEELASLANQSQEILFRNFTS